MELSTKHNCSIRFNEEFPVPAQPNSYCNRTDPDSRLLSSDEQYNRVYGMLMALNALVLKYVNFRVIRIPLGILMEQFDPSMSEEMKRRSRILFYHTFDDNARFFSYGICQHYVLSFMKATKEYVHPLLHKAMYDQDNSIRISVHLRHSDSTRVDHEDSEEPFDNLILNAIRLFREKFNTTENCYVFVASDRMKSIDRVSEYSHTIGCVPLVVKRDSTNQKKDKAKEHGLYATGVR